MGRGGGGGAGEELLEEGECGAVFIQSITVNMVIIYFMVIIAIIIIHISSKKGSFSYENI